MELPKFMTDAKRTEQITEAVEGIRNRATPPPIQPAYTVAAASANRAIARINFAKNVEANGRFTRLTVEDTLRLEMEQAAYAIYMTNFATAEDIDRLISASLALRSVIDK